MNKDNANSSNKKKIFRIAGIIGMVYFTGGAALYYLQKKLMLHPKQLPPNYKFQFSFPFKELFIDIEPGVRINGLHFFSKDSIGLILYLHGNTRSIKGWAKYAKDFYRYHYDVVLVDYRGFGKSTGKRGEKAMFRDMQVVYDTLAV
ncbi:MAG: alpha/beta hydrolase, partial [Bacteroidota bacterium]|nr:alpha/beta hydrolase [Bacteroidota bacterium]